uniref:Uncharacterized protein LOC104213303 n=1 Tax=Nicotiana sylvestris TaxID=4096 RepID=A0A1U7VFG8_NICSY|nr:PREDICTED: uncharacterized protein LOC104213303 [Nicotiana sylvestris]
MECEGMNDPNKRAIIKVGVREWGANLVCFQETKLEVLSDVIVRSVWGGSWVKYDWVPAVGSAGGILLMWDDRSLEVKEIKKGAFSLAALVKDRVSGVEWGFGGVYGPVGEGSKVFFWEELANMMGEWDIPWFLGGDFNTIKFPEERLGCSMISRAMEEFSDFINDHFLIDLPLSGERFTWARAEDSNSRSRLDRFLISPSWDELVPNMLQIPLPRLTSDHLPILLDGCRGRGVRAPFRFENMWLKVPGFGDKVKEWWTSYGVSGTPSFRLSKKLKLLKGDIIRWNKEVFGRVEVKMRELMYELGDLERGEGARELDESEKERFGGG